MDLSKLIPDGDIGTIVYAVTGFIVFYFSNLEINHDRSHLLFTIIGVLEPFLELHLDYRILMLMQIKLKKVLLFF